MNVSNATILSTAAVATAMFPTADVEHDDFNSLPHAPLT